jgi:serine/threonine protein kinase
VKLIGTPDYIAPEIISHISIKNYTIDWWSLGVMTYEMLIGARPFSAETIEEVIENITSYKIEWPEIGYEEGMISPEAKDLISQLLNTDFTSRLGANGVEEVKSHPFFKGIDWDNLKNSRPPMIPKMSSISQLQEMKEDKDLREEVYKLVGSSNKLNKRLNLERFVRFDLLGDETIENVEKLYE